MGRAVNAATRRPVAILAWLMIWTGLPPPAAAAGQFDATIIHPDDTRPDPGFAVTATTSADRMVIDHSRRLWLLTDGNPVAMALTGPEERIRRPALSPDGRQLAYETVRENHHQIAIYDFAAATSRQITFGPYDHHAPAWSPQGDRIVISSNRGGTFDLWEIDTEQLLLKQLTTAPSAETEPAWSREGLLAWVNRSGEFSELLLGIPGHSSRTIMRTPHRLAGPAFRPGGGVLTVAEVDAEGSRLLMLLLSTPPAVKPLTDSEQVSPAPVQWLDRTAFLYTADGQIRRRILGLQRFSQVAFFLTELPGGH